MILGAMSHWGQRPYCTGEFSWSGEPGCPLRVEQELRGLTAGHQPLGYAGREGRGGHTLCENRAPASQQLISPPISPFIPVPGLLEGHAALTEPAMLSWDSAVRPRPPP